MGNLAWLFLNLGIILLAAESFTNGVEWLGHKLRLGDGAVGSVLAAVGTALPETLIPVIAFFGGQTEELADIGIGAILGAPFMLATLAFFISGLTVLLTRRRNQPLRIDTGVVRRDLGFFLAAYVLAVLTSFLPEGISRHGVVLVLLALYIWYLMMTLLRSRGKHEAAQPAPLYLARSAAPPSLVAVLAQIGVALAALVWGAHGFVEAVQAVAKAAGWPVLVLSLIITPIATELPEKFNSVVWLRQGKDTLALGNITGAMVFQSSVIPALGIAMTPWRLDSLALTSALLAVGAAMMPYLSLLRRGGIRPTTLLCGGLFYAVFLLGLIYRP